MANIKIEGYAQTFEPYTNQDWTESVTREALEEAVRNAGNVRLTMGDAVLATTGDGSLELSVDDRGLKIAATLNLGYVYRVWDQEWADDYTERTITGLALDSLQVSLRAPRE